MIEIDLLSSNIDMPYRALRDNFAIGVCTISVSSGLNLSEIKI